MRCREQYWVVLLLHLGRQQSGRRTLIQSRQQGWNLFWMPNSGCKVLISGRRWKGWGPGLLDYGHYSVFIITNVIDCQLKFYCVFPDSY